MDEQNKPHVRIFGGETKPWKDCHCHHHRRHSGVGGLLLVFAGIIFLLNSTGVLPWEFWNFVWPLWPVLLIIIGLRIILGRIPGSNALIFLVALVLFSFVVIYALVHVNSLLVNYLPKQLNLWQE